MKSSPSVHLLDRGIASRPSQQFALHCDSAFSSLLNNEIDTLIASASDSLYNKPRLQQHLFAELLILKW